MFSETGNLSLLTSPGQSCVGIRVDKELHLEEVTNLL